MTDHINDFRLKVRNTQKLSRPSVTFSLQDAVEVEKAITALEKKISELERELLKDATLTIDIVGSEF
jgi:hypothetical protein